LEVFVHKSLKLVLKSSLKFEIPYKKWGKSLSFPEIPQTSPIMDKNNSAFTAFLLANAGIAVGGLFTVASGAYAITEKGHFDWLSACFIVVGLGMLAAAVIAYYSKTIEPLLRHQIMCSAVILALEVAFAYSVLAENQSSALISLPHSQAVRYVPVVCSALLLLSILTGWCHLRTLQTETGLKSPLQAAAYKH